MTTMMTTMTMTVIMMMTMKALLVTIHSFFNSSGRSKKTPNRRYAFKELPVLRAIRPAHSRWVVYRDEFSHFLVCHFIGK